MTFDNELTGEFARSSGPKVPNQPSVSDNEKLKYPIGVKMKMKCDGSYEISYDGFTLTKVKPPTCAQLASIRRTLETLFGNGPSRRR
jgi:hypothetical protein